MGAEIVPAPTEPWGFTGSVVRLMHPEERSQVKQHNRVWVFIYLNSTTKPQRMPTTMLNQEGVSRMYPGVGLNLAEGPNGTGHYLCGPKCPQTRIKNGERGPVSPSWTWGLWLRPIVGSPGSRTLLLSGVWTAAKGKSPGHICWEELVPSWDPTPWQDRCSLHMGARKPLESGFGSLTPVHIHFFFTWLFLSLCRQRGV